MNEINYNGNEINDITQIFKTQDSTPRVLHTTLTYIIHENATEFTAYSSLINNKFILNEDFIKYFSFLKPPEQKLFKFFETTWYMFAISSSLDSQTIYIKRIKKNINLDYRDKIEASSIILPSLGDIVDYNMFSSDSLVVLFTNKARVYSVNSQFTDYKLEYEMIDLYDKDKNRRP